MMHRHVISTGGGAVVRPINWYNNLHTNEKSFTYAIPSTLLSSVSLHI